MRPAFLAFAFALPALTLPAGAQGCPNPQPPQLLLPTYDPANRGLAVAGYQLDADDHSLVISDPYFRHHSNPASPPRGRLCIFRNSADVWTREAEIDYRTLGDLSLFAVHDTQLIVLSKPAAPAQPRYTTFERSLDAQQNPVWLPVGAITRPAASRMKRVGDLLFLRLAAEIQIQHINSPTDWTLEDSFAAPTVALDPDPVECFDTDGQTIIDARAGTVRVYRHGAQGWHLETTLPGRPGSPAPHAWGVSVSVRGDRAAIGANWEPAGSLTGYVRIFHRDPSGQWNLEADLTHPSLSASVTGFGISVTLSDDRLLVGAHRDSAAGPTSGAVHVFQRNGTAWSTLATYAAPESPGATLGWNTALLGTQIVASGWGLEGTGGAVVFDACSLPTTGDATPRCLPGVGGLFAFFDAFFTGNPFADFNQDQTITIQDAFDFLNAWFAGCP